MAIETTKADGYRKRAEAAGKRLPTRSGPAYLALQRKQKALNDMANLEDWLDGEPLPTTKSKGRTGEEPSGRDESAYAMPRIQRVRIEVVR
jgi:hypothetical protein